MVGVLSPRMRWLNWEDWETGRSGGPEGSKQANYRQEVRDRVLKDAVKLERPDFV